MNIRSYALSIGLCKYLTYEGLNEADDATMGVSLDLSFYDHKD